MIDFRSGHEPENVEEIASDGEIGDLMIMMRLPARVTPAGFIVC